MKLVDKKTEEKNKTTINDLERELQIITKHLYAECNQCDGTGKPKTKNGEPPKGGYGSARCGICKGSGTLSSRLDMLETDIANIRKELSRVKTTLNTHINKQSVEIRILPEGHNPALHGGNEPDKWKNGWEDYSGKFDLSSNEEMSIVIGKAMAHFDKYFKDGFYHSNKRLGVFLSSATTSGRRLIEEFHTEE
jgi:hypothetical protein